MEAVSRATDAVLTIQNVGRGAETRRLRPASGMAEDNKLPGRKYEVDTFRRS